MRIIVNHQNDMMTFCHRYLNTAECALFELKIKNLPSCEQQHPLELHMSIGFLTVEDKLSKIWNRWKLDKLC
uniref:Bm14092 n=1 Tax=Brugia malayi TaxID=6279 RepID=A0A1I9FZK3_BRUMA|nr:Bm14092 [Brugia malayi]